MTAIEPMDWHQKVFRAVKASLETVFTAAVLASCFGKLQLAMFYGQIRKNEYNGLSFEEIISKLQQKNF